MHQLLNLFGCEYREGLAASAPLLRPHGSEGREGGHSTGDPLPTFVSEVEAMTHDANILPHMYSAEQIDEMFPTINAAPETENAEDYIEMGVRQGRLSRSDHLVANSMCV